MGAIGGGPARDAAGEDAVRHRWWWVLDRLRSHSPTTELLLRAARLEGVRDDDVTVSWLWHLHRDLVDELPRRAMVEEAMEAVLDRPYRLRCVVRDV